MNKKSALYLLRTVQRLHMNPPIVSSIFTYTLLRKIQSWYLPQVPPRIDMKPHTHFTEICTQFLDRMHNIYKHRNTFKRCLRSKKHRCGIEKHAFVDLHGSTVRRESMAGVLIMLLPQVLQRLHGQSELRNKARFHALIDAAIHVSSNPEDLTRKHSDPCDRIWLQFSEFLRS